MKLLAKLKSTPISCCISLLLFLNTHAHAQISPINTIITSEYLFNDCEKTKLILAENAQTISPTDRDRLAKYIKRIIKLEPNSHLIKSNPGFIPPHTATSTFDLAIFLDPERDKKAKLCAIELIPSLLPYSASTIVPLIELAIDRKNNPELRNKAIHEYIEIIKLIQREGFPDFLTNEITQDLLNSKEAARNKLALPLLVLIQNPSGFAKRDLLNEQDSVLRENIFDSFMLNNYARSDSESKIIEYLNNIDDGAKAQLIAKLKFFLKTNPNLIEIIPTLLSYQNELVRIESIKFIRYVAAHPALYAAYYINNPFPNIILEQLIETGKTSDEALQKDILTIIFPIDIQKSSKLCTEKQDSDKASFSSDEYSFDSALYLIESLNCNDLLRSFNPDIKKSSLDEILLNTTALNINDNVKDRYLKQLLDNVKVVKSKYSTKEYTSYISILLHSALKLSSLQLRDSLIPLAIEGLNLNLEPNYLQQLFSQNTKNPAIEYLRINFKTAELRLIKLLLKKSPSILKKVLASIPKDKQNQIRYRKQTISNLSKLLSDPNIEIRRSAFLALKTQSSAALKHLLPAKKTGNNNLPKAETLFYLSRLALEGNIELSSKEKKISKEFFIDSLNTIDCRERTSLYTFIKQKVIVDSSIKDNPSESIFSEAEKNDIALSQLNCLHESREITIRALKNLAYLKPFTQEIKLDLSNQLSKLINSSSNNQVTTSSLNLLLGDKKTDSIVPILKVGLQSNYAESRLSSLHWLTNNIDYIRDVENELKNNLNNQNPKIGLISALLLYSLNESPEYLNSIRQKFFANLEQATNIFDIEVSKLEISKLKQTGLNESNSTYGLFLNYLFCISKNDSESCEKVVLPLVLLNDKPFYVVHLLNHLITHQNSENPTFEKLSREVVLKFIQTGHYKELTPLNNRPEMIRIINDLRKSTTSIPDAKTLDFLLQY